MFFSDRAAVVDITLRSFLFVLPLLTAAQWCSLLYVVAMGVLCVCCLCLSSQARNRPAVCVGCYRRVICVFSLFVVCCGCCCCRVVPSATER